MMPELFPTLWQAHPASCRDIVDFLNSLDLTDEELARGREYLGEPEPRTCCVDGCEEPIRTSGMCKRHYWNLWYREIRGKPKPIKVPQTSCMEDNCEEIVYCRRRCRHHYDKMYHLMRKAKRLKRVAEGDTLQT